MTTTKFKELAVGLFFLCATALMLSSFYRVFTDWENLWSKAFGNFGSISEAIVSLEKTAMPVSVTVPDMLEQIHAMLYEMQAMNRSIDGMARSVEEMNRSVANMAISVQNLDVSVRGLSYSVPQEMREMPRQMSPWKMMSPFQ